MTDIPFLENLSREQFELFSPLLKPFVVQPKTTIFEQGDEAIYLHLITNGTVSIQYKPYDGPEIVLTRLHAGDIFGWSSVIGGEKYTSSAVSVTKLETLRIRGKDLRQLCVDHKEAGCAILEKLAEMVSPRWTDAKDQVRDMLQNKIKTKKFLA